MTVLSHVIYMWLHCRELYVLGTGKTLIGVKIAYWFYKRNDATRGSGATKKQVLFCGPSNSSVDVVAGMMNGWLLILTVYCLEKSWLIGSGSPLPEVLDTDGCEKLATFCAVRCYSDTRLLLLYETSSWPVSQKVQRTSSWCNCLHTRQCMS